MATTFQASRDGGVHAETSHGDLATTFPLVACEPAAYDVGDLLLPSPTVQKLHDMGVGAALRVMQTAHQLEDRVLMEECVVWLETLLTKEDNVLLQALSRALDPSPLAPLPRKRSVGQRDEEEENFSTLTIPIPWAPLQDVLGRMDLQRYRRIVREHPNLEFVWGAASAGGAKTSTQPPRFTKLWLDNVANVCNLWKVGLDTAISTNLSSVDVTAPLASLRVLGLRDCYDHPMLRVDVLPDAVREQIHTVELSIYIADDIARWVVGLLRELPNLCTLVVKQKHRYEEVVEEVIAHRIDLQDVGCEDTTWCQRIVIHKRGEGIKLHGCLEKFGHRLDAWPIINGMTPYELALSQGMMVDFDKLVPADPLADLVTCTVDREGRVIKASLLLAVLKAMRRANATNDEHRKLHRRLLGAIIDRHGPKRPHPEMAALSEPNIPQCLSKALLRACGHVADMRQIIAICSCMPTWLRVKYMTSSDAWYDGDPHLYDAEMNIFHGYCPMTYACLTQRFAAPSGGRLRQGCTFWHMANVSHDAKRLVSFVRRFHSMHVSKKIKPFTLEDANEHGETPLMMGNFGAALANGERGQQTICDLLEVFDVKTKLVKPLLRRVDHSGHTLAHHFCQRVLLYGHTATERRLKCESLALGEALAGCCDIRDNHNKTALHCLLQPTASAAAMASGDNALKGVQDVVQCLLLAAPSLARDTTEYLQCLLHSQWESLTSSPFASTLFLRLLLRAGRCVKTWRDAQGNNLAHLAARSKVRPHLGWLAIAGVSLDAANDDSQTPLQIAGITRRSLLLSTDFREYLASCEPEGEWSRRDWPKALARHWGGLTLNPDGNAEKLYQWAIHDNFGQRLRRDGRRLLACYCGHSSYVVGLRNLLVDVGLSVS